MIWQRLRYFGRETGLSLIRNIGMTIAVILTTVVTLVLVGGTLLLNKGIDKGEQEFSGSQAFEIFMLVKADEGQIKGVSEALAADRRVKTSEFISQEAAYERFKSAFGEKNPSLVEATKPEILPTSFIVTPKNAREARTLKTVYEQLPGVDEISLGDASIKQMFDLFGSFKNIFLYSAIALGVSSVALIVIAIRLAMVARRREIEVMKLVGASNTFIRIPFVLEGVLQGVVGAIIAVPTVLYPLREALNDAASNSNSRIMQTVSFSEAIPSAALLCVCAIGVGMVGSIIGLWKFLDV